MAWAISCQKGSSEFSRRIPSRVALSHLLISSEAGSPLWGFILRSRGPSSLKVNPREGLSNCMEETPRSARMKSKPSGTSVRSFSIPAKFILRKRRSSSEKPNLRNRSSVLGNSIGSASMASSLPLWSSSSSSRRACPP